MLLLLLAFLAIFFRASGLSLTEKHEHPLPKKDPNVLSNCMLIKTVLSA